MVRKNKGKFQVISTNGTAIEVKLMVNDDRVEKGWIGTVYEIDGDQKRYHAPQPPFSTNDTGEEINDDSIKEE